MPNITWKDGNVQKVNMQKVKDLLSAEGPVMLIIYADWCGHCQHSEPEWNKLSKLVPNKVFAIESSEYTDSDVSSYPTIKIIRKGKSKVYDGDRSAENMKEALLLRGGRKRTRRFRSGRFRRRTRHSH